MEKKVIDLQKVGENIQTASYNGARTVYIIINDHTITNLGFSN